MNNLLFLLLITVTILLNSCSAGKRKTSETNEEEWQSLFDGKSLDGWIVKIHKHDVGDNYANTFKVKDRAIRVNYAAYSEFGMRFGHLFYHKPFSSYHLKFKYRFTQEWMWNAPVYTYRNSGIMFHSQDPHTILKDQNWPISVEYQILARENDSTLRSTANVCSPGTEVFYEHEMDPRHCIPSSSETYNWDQWISGDLIVYQDSLIIHMVEGDTVLQYTKPQIGGEVIKNFNPDIKIDGKRLTKGYIGLQAEGQGIEFREIKIKTLELSNRD